MVKGCGKYLYGEESCIIYKGRFDHALGKDFWGEHFYTGIDGPKGLPVCCGDSNGGGPVRFRQGTVDDVILCSVCTVKLGFKW